MSVVEVHAVVWLNPASQTWQASHSESSLRSGWNRPAGHAPHWRSAVAVQFATAYSPASQAEHMLHTRLVVPVQGAVSYSHLVWHSSHGRQSRSYP